MWVVHRVLRSGYSLLNSTGIFSTPLGRRGYELLYEQYKVASEGASIDLLCSTIAPASLAIDVGANIGIYTERFAARVGPTGRVIALEPDPTNAQSLRRRFRDKPWVHVVEAAASDVPGTVHLAQDADNPAGHALSDRGLEVKAVTIDDLVAEAALPLSAMKIDVEGAEPLVLKGAAKSIRAHRPAMLLEYSPERISGFGADPMGILGEMEGLEYRFAVAPDPTIRSAAEVHEASRRKGYVDVLIHAGKLASPSPRRTWMERVAMLVLAAVAIAPAMFLFAMIQMSQLTVPFWDHWEQAEFVIDYHDKGLGAAVWHVLTGLSQHTRPVTVRMIFLLNGILTDWNIATEYVYMYLTIALVLVTHYLIIRKLAGTQRVTVTELALFSVVALLVCSPAGHNNHWWSWMLQLNLNNLLTVLALAVIAFNPRRWSANVIAAILCWLSVYTLTNGLFLILIVAGLAQLASEEPLKVRAKSIFWIVNILVVYKTYFPIAEPGMSANPSLVDVGTFALIYLGQPIAAMVVFPYESMFEPPPKYALGILFGAVVLSVFALLVAVNRRNLLRPSTALLILLGFGGAALASAMATGWARVSFDAYGVRNGGSSRYILTGSLMTIGILYYGLADKANLAQRLQGVRVWSDVRPFALPVGIVVYLLFVALCARAYSDSVKIYLMARGHERLIAAGFRPDGAPTPVDQFLYPNQPRLQKLRSDLLRLGLGPYRTISEASASLASSTFVDGVALVPGARFVQNFNADRSVRKLSFPMVTWGKKPSDYAVNWRLSASEPGKPKRVLGQGTIAAPGITDWQTIEIRPQESPRAEEHEYEFSLEVPPGASVASPVGIPIFVPAPPSGGVRSLPGPGGERGVLALNVKLR